MLCLKAALQYYDYYSRKYKFEKDKREIKYIGYLSRPIAYLLAMKEIYIRTKDHSILDYEASKWHYDLYGTYLYPASSREKTLVSKGARFPMAYGSFRPDSRGTEWSPGNIS